MQSVDSDAMNKLKSAAKLDVVCLLFNLLHQQVFVISSAFYFCLSFYFSFSFISNQMIYTTSNGRMRGSSQPFGKFCLTLFCVLSVLFGHHLKIQQGKIPAPIFKSLHPINSIINYQ